MVRRYGSVRSASSAPERDFLRLRSEVRITRRGMTGMARLNTVEDVKGAGLLELDGFWPRWMHVAFPVTAIILGIAVAAEPRPGYSLGVRIALSAVPPVLWTACAVLDWPRFRLRAPL